MGSTTSTVRTGRGKATAGADSASVLASPSSAHRHNITCIKFFGTESELLVTASEDRTLRIWDFGSEQKLGQVWELNRLLDAHSQGAAKANSEAGAGPVAALRLPLAAHPAEGHQHWVTCMDLDLRSSVVYSGSMDKTVKAWDMYSGRCMRTYSGHADWVLSVHVRPRMLYSCAEDGCVRLWKLSTLLGAEAGAGAEEGGCWEAHEVAMKAVAQEGEHLLTGDVRGGVKYWSLLDGSCEAAHRTGVGVVTCLAMPYHAAERRASELREEGKESVQREGARGGGVTMFVGGSEGVVEWREVLKTEREEGVLVSYRHGERGAITAMEILDGTLFTGSEDRTVRAWGVESGACVQLYVGALSAIRALAVLPAQGLLCSAASDLRLWDLASADVLAVLHWKQCEAAAVHPAAACVIAASAGQLRCYPLPPSLKPKDKGKPGAGGVLRPLLGTVRPRTPPDKASAVPNGLGGKKAGMNGVKH